MKKSLAVPCIAVLMTLLTGCSSTLMPTAAKSSDATSDTAVPGVPSSLPTAECPPTPIDVTIDYELDEGSGGISILAVTNLPDGSLMNASFFVENGFLAQDEGTVDSGKVTFGPFSDKGAPLHGSYHMSITLPIARNQPDEVQRCIGERGENLTGPFVSIEQTTGDKVAGIDVQVLVD